METAILVDWTLYRHNPYTQDFVYARRNHTKLVMLVSDPTESDYEPINPYKDLDFDVIIRNTGDLPVVAFKTTATQVLMEVSNLVPVIGLDSNAEVNAMYREVGVLITIDDL